MNREIQHVFLVGAKSLGAYGGYETFVNKLTEYHQYNGKIKYHVACKANGDGCMDESRLTGVAQIRRSAGGTVTEFTYQNARCFKIRVPNIGPAQAVYYDLAALWECCRYIETHGIPHPIVYIMACRIGPFMGFFARWIHKLGGRVFLNPDGHEWMRAKWNRLIRRYWKVSEEMMVLRSDLVICDSVNIEKYIRESYGRKSASGIPTTYIAYGAEIRDDENGDAEALEAWYSRHGLEAGNYYLIVGRFVPENNFETMIREFMASKSSRSLAVITNVNDRFLQQLEQRLGFSADPRIRFVGTVYDQALLAQIRLNACGYLHGHEVGGTNPSLLEALGTTKLNLLLDVGFNREVAGDAALYWSKEPGDLAKLIGECDALPAEQIREIGRQAKKRIETCYSWRFIADRYEEVFCTEQAVCEQTKRSL